MAGEIVKWKPADLSVRRLIDEALEIGRRFQEIEPRREPSVSLPGEFARGIQSLAPPVAPMLHTGPSTDDVLDLPRICTVHDRLSFSRYVETVNGRFEYKGPIGASKSRIRLQYEDVQGRVLPSQYLDEEECFWCGSTGYGAIFCNLCKAFVCYGKTVHKRFKCRPSCGAVGELVSKELENFGLHPSVRRP